MTPMQPLLTLLSHAERERNAAMADAKRLEQVVVNLLSNALRYSDPGGVVTVSVRPDGDEALLEVRDTGIGSSVLISMRLCSLPWYQL